MSQGLAVRWAQAALVLLLGGWGIAVAAGRASWSFLDGVNLVFHEAGHVLFAPAGEFVGVMGGTLGQLLVPAVCAAAFLWRGESFGAGLCGIWTGQSLANVSTYLADARARQLPLLGGDDVIHDWNYLLGRLGLLTWDRGLAATLAVLAGLVILAAALFAALGSLRQPPTER